MYYQRRTLPGLGQTPEMSAPDPLPPESPITGIVEYKMPYPGIAQTHLTVADVVILPSQRVPGSVDVYNAMRRDVRDGDTVTVWGEGTLSRGAPLLVPSDWVVREEAGVREEGYTPPGIIDLETFSSTSQPSWLDQPEGAEIRPRPAVQDPEVYEETEGLTNGGGEPVPVPGETGPGVSIEDAEFEAYGPEGNGAAPAPPLQLGAIDMSNPWVWAGLAAFLLLLRRR